MNYNPTAVTGIRNLRIVKFLIHETGSYNAQYRRPYNTTLTNNDLQVFQERLGGSKHFVPEAIGGLASQFITPSATPEKELTIANGWDQRRMRFMMELEYDFHTGGSSTEVVMGWTSHNGVTLNRAIDPQMEFYVNSVMQIRKTVQHIAGIGNQEFNSVIDSSHILSNNNFKGIYDPQIDQRLRPEDVYTAMSRAQLSKFATGPISDTRAMVSAQAVKSRRTNSSGANYMARILEDYSNAAENEEFGQSNDQMLDKARGFSQEKSVARDPFLKMISEARNNSAGIQNVFTYGDLERVDPNVRHVTKAMLLGPTELATVHHTGQTEGWGGTNMETSCATILSQSVPGIMMDFAMMVVYFRSTNRDINNRINTLVMNAEGFSSGDQSHIIQQFIVQLEQTVLRSLSFDNQVDFAIEMHVDLLGESRIKVSINSGPVIEYVTPSFCDALMVPVVTMDNSRAMTLAGDFESLASSLAEARNNYRAPPSIMSSGGTQFGNL